MGKKELEDISVHLLHETDKAILVTDDGKTRVWLPKSMVEYTKDEGADTYTVTGPVRFLKEKGLL